MRDHGRLYTQHLQWSLCTFIYMLIQIDVLSVLLRCYIRRFAFLYTNAFYLFVCTKCTAAWFIWRRWRFKCYFICLHCIMCMWWLRLQRSLKVWGVKVYLLFYILSAPFLILLLILFHLVLLTRLFLLWNRHCLVHFLYACHLLRWLHSVWRYILTICIYIYICTAVTVCLHAILQHRLLHYLNRFHTRRLRTWCTSPFTHLTDVIVAISNVRNNRSVITNSTTTTIIVSSTTIIIVFVIVGIVVNVRTVSSFLLIV